MSARTLAVLGVALLAGCSWIPGASIPSRSTVTLVTRLAPAAALDSIAVWAAGSDDVRAERDGDTLALRDIRPREDNAALVTVGARADGLTQIVVESEYVFRGEAMADLGLRAASGLYELGVRTNTLPVEGSATCFSPADGLDDPIPSTPLNAEPPVDETAPELIGGLAGLAQRVVYPETLRRAGVEGEVVASFVIGVTGAVECVEVIASPHPGLSAAAVEAVRGSMFTPGSQDGEPIKVRFAVPVRFRLR